VAVNSDAKAFNDAADARAEATANAADAQKLSEEAASAAAAAAAAKEAGAAAAAALEARVLSAEEMAAQARAAAEAAEARANAAEEAAREEQRARAAAEQVTCLLSSCCYPLALLQFSRLVVESLLLNPSRQDFSFCLHLFSTFSWAISFLYL